MPSIAAVTNVKRKHIERERRMKHHKYDKQAQQGLVMFHSDDIESKMDKRDTITCIISAPGFFGVLAASFYGLI
tara:strand:+ start:3934 stop:4155 length:222 start_codon:yes stop_codon:yes gene_type:complete